MYAHVVNPFKKLSINAHYSTPSRSIQQSSPTMAQTCKLFVGNLATQTTSSQLQTIFHQYGQVIECVKVRERYGFVRFNSADEAREALKACNGMCLHGYKMMVEYAQNEILISPLSPASKCARSNVGGGRTIHASQDTKLTTPISVITNRAQYSSSHKCDDMPLLTTPSTTTGGGSSRLILSTLNPEASSFITSDYCSSGSSTKSFSVHSSSPSILSEIPSPSTLTMSPVKITDSNIGLLTTSVEATNQNEKRQSFTFIGDKILSLYGGNSLYTDESDDGYCYDSESCSSSLDYYQNSHTKLKTSTHNSTQKLVFDNRRIDARDPIFIWNFALYPDCAISPFIKRGDIKGFLEKRVLLYSR
ncbi:unnamed protein product [Didymodactylos carnosus]|uniref:RRM domain-containing protein n=1 Tax=Didymodactylos carnosus TaxID=1234261 RepID=A0A813Q0P1_9BILA|nr:unnamed protein product [Didymodactylos carnosus]CAF0773405.1 unnamed protein product [Didymodactylos carnosus]CAF3537666.1 unnamed protein product [Didymodactylos carnosus]CAF3554426.1 unnamed protein product [Didymodactylos carnosus]